jgi:hypothetical protein
LVAGGLSSLNSKLNAKNSTLKNEVRDGTTTKRKTNRKKENRVHRSS